MNLKVSIDIRNLNWIYLLPVMLGLLGAGLILFATTQYGVGLSSDSVWYISSAQNISKGYGYTDHVGKPLTVFPPLFSMALAVIGQGQLELDIVARYLNAILFGLLVGLSSYWMLTKTNSPVLSLMGTAAIIFSRPLVEVSVYAWSEPLFIFLTLMALFQMVQFSTTENYQPIVLAGVFTALACLTRYAGASLIITGVLLLVLEWRKSSLGRWIKRLIVFATIAVVPLCLWLLRNYAISGSLTGDRPASNRSLTTSIGLAVDIITNWALPSRIPITLRATIVMLLLIVLILTLIFAHRRNIMRIDSRHYKQLLPILLFIPLYSVFLITSVSLSALSPIDNRYLAPIYVPMALLGIFFLNEIGQIIIASVGSQVVKYALLLVLVAWLIYPVKSVAGLVRWYYTNGVEGFHSAQWVNSEVVAYLNSHTMQGSIYTNEREAIYILTGNLFKGSPRQYKYESSTPVDDLLHFEEDIKQRGHVYLIMFHGDWWRQYLYDVEFYKSKYQLNEIMAGQDGGIYRVELPTSNQKGLVVDGIQSDK